MRSRFVVRSMMQPRYESCTRQVTSTLRVGWDPITSYDSESTRRSSRRAVASKEFISYDLDYSVLNRKLYNFGSTHVTHFNYVN